MTLKDDSDKKRRILELLTGSYVEVLDATKHQDDKIGRLFTGISFLTAAALALANLGAGQYLRQTYAGWEGAPPPAMLFLAIYLVLVVLAVMLLINSLATPLRVPGLSRINKKPTVAWVNGVKSSQLYFGEISKLGLLEWERKWTGKVDELEAERAQALVGETHNLAVRTQFKYGRTSEAIAIFGLALLSLSLTIVLCLTASTIAVPPQGSVSSVATPVPFPAWSQWTLGAATALFYFVQLQGQVRYSRQTVDELEGRNNGWGALLRYLWVVMATVWALMVGSGQFRTQPGTSVVTAVGIVGILGLLVGTYLQRRQKRKVETAVEEQPRLAEWLGCGVAVLFGIPLTWFHSQPNGWFSGYAGSLGLALIGALGLTCLSLMSPTMTIIRNSRKFSSREKERQLPGQ